MTEIYSSGLGGLEIEIRVPACSGEALFWVSDFSWQKGLVRPVGSLL